MSAMMDDPTGNSPTFRHNLHGLRSASGIVACELSVSVVHEVVAPQRIDDVKAGKPPKAICSKLVVIYEWFPAA